jgi:aspartyl-tRNA(Asn)/glutamyl-tRNA(Gln) amidotransferase subunit C
MAIDRAEAARIAALARLELPDAELERVAAQLSQVLEFAARLDELDLTGLEPSAFAPAGTPLRADAPDDRTLAPGTATGGASEAEFGYFLVPPVVDALEP